MRGLVVLNHTVLYPVPVSDDGDRSPVTAAVELDAGESVVGAGESDPGAHVEGDPAGGGGRKSERAPVQDNVPALVVSIADDYSVTNTGHAQGFFQLFRTGDTQRALPSYHLDHRVGVEKQQTQQQLFHFLQFSYQSELLIAHISINVLL